MNQREYERNLGRLHSLVFRDIDPLYIRAGLNGKLPVDSRTSWAILRELCRVLREFKGWDTLIARNCRVMCWSELYRIARWRNERS